MASPTSDRNANRKFLFELSDEETLNPGKRIRFAEVLPQVRKVDNEAERENLDMDRTSFQYIINTLWRNRHLVARNRQWLETRLASQTGCTDTHFGTISTLKALDGTFLFQYFANNPNLDQAVLEKACIHDPETAHQMAVFAFGALLTLRFSKEAKCKAICVLALKALEKRAGNRIGNWIPPVAVTDVGTLNWQQMGPYEAIVVSSQLTKVKHRPTGDDGECPAMFKIEVPFKFVNAWSDMECTLVKDDFAEQVCKWFKPGTGPKKIEVLKGSSTVFNTIIDEANVEHQKASAAASGLVASPTKSVVAEAATAKRKETMMKARVALKETKDLMAKTRASIIDG